MNKIVYLVLSFLIVLWSCGNDNNEPDAYGNFEVDEIMASSKVPGEIVSLDIEEGQQVNKGAFLGNVDTTTFYLQLKQATVKNQALNGKISSARAQKDVLEAQISTSQTDLNRITNMLKSGAATQASYDKAKGQMDVLKNQLKAAESEINSANRELEASDVQAKIIRKQLDDCYFIAPISGTILEKYLSRGEMAITGRPVYKIASLDTLDLRAYISGDQLSSVKIGQQVKVFIDGKDDSLIKFPGRISWISSEAEFTPKIIQTKDERVNLVYAMKIRVPNDGTLKSGMPAEVKF